MLNTPSIYYTNCRSLNDQKLEDLKQYTTRYDPDLVCLTETWFTKARQDNSELPGYNLYASNRQTRIGGGVAVYLRSCIDGKVLDRYVTPTVSAIWLLLSYPKMPKMIICCFYHPPSADNNASLRYLEETMCKLSAKHKNTKFLLSGDFNQLPLDFFCKQFNVRCCVDFCTRGNAVLDQIITDIDQYPKPIKLPPLVGNEEDHCGILMGSTKIKRYEYVKITRRNVTAGSKQQVLLNLAKQDWSKVLASPCVDSKTETMNSIIINILDKYCPLKTYKTRADKPGYINSTLDKLMKARDRARKDGKKSWKYLSQLCKVMLRNCKKQYVNRKLNQASTSKTWWKSIKQIEGKATETVNDFHLIDDTWVSTEKLVDILGSHFVQVGGQRDASKTPHVAQEPLSDISIGEVKHLMRNLDVTKSTNSDDFPPWISKAACEDLCVPVTNILNCMLRTNKYPEIWKQAEIRPIKKIKNPSCPGDYRPISLLHHLGKIAEQVILQRLKSGLGFKLNNNQYAYQQKRSTTDALLHIIHDWCLQLDDIKTSHVTATLIDMSKAFDKMNPNILIEKLLSLDINQGLISLIDNSSVVVDAA